ncbi:MAG TPA: hypothetical protein VGC04_12885 [Cellulomonas sp.]
MAAGPARLAADETVRGRHLLALPTGPGPDDVGSLAASRFPAARWEEPEAGLVRAAGGAPLRVLRLGRLSRLIGPYGLGPEVSAALGLHGQPATVWQLECPVERGDLPAVGGDRDGLKRAFPGGMPVREEERAIQWLVAVARRLGGSVRIGGAGTLLTPDPAAAVDLVVYTDRWLEPDQLLATARQVVRRARPSGAGDRYLGNDEPVDPRLSAHLGRHGVRDDRERARLAAEATAYDAYMMSHPQTETGYGVEANLDVDGILVVEVAGQDEVPLVLASAPWARQGVVAYRIHWEPADFTELESERPSMAHRVARGRAAPQVRGVARVLHGVVGGAILDEAEFPVDPTTL